ncbi:hypothetical protein G6F57_020001 [Rhizopus arrhizus]|nr:hypothetical protein G6F57_020001 [Rhizopus arrhizus]
MRQAVETPVNHPQGVAQILLAARAPGQIGKVGRDARAVGRLVILIKRDALDAEAGLAWVQAATASRSVAALEGRINSTKGNARWTASLARSIRASSCRR